ncbi:MAG: phosphatidate cytidylyltransferase [Clostridia bacterium]|nr:phosphatidate cytidylyltransferase [Clostridia bacterium]
MLKRIITAVLMIAVLLPVMYFSGGYIFEIAVAFLSVVAVYELLECTQLTKEYAVCIPLFLYAVAMPLYVGISYRYVYNLTVLVIFVIFSVSVFSKGKCSIEKLASLSAFVVYVVSSFTALIILRRGEFGEYIIWLVIIGACVTDTAAYFTGFVCGKHKLIPDVSPKKTVEGAVGGIVFCTAAYIIYGLWVEKTFPVKADILFLGIAGFIVSIVSQLGDLVASKIKRHYNIKDFGKIFPGHGGVLDRFDSIIAVAAFLLVITSCSDVIPLFKL